MKFGLPLILLGAWAASSFAQSCTGGFFSQNVRERHVTVSRSFAPRTGCTGTAFALVPTTVYKKVPVNTVAAPVAPQAAPAKPMPVVPAPVLAVETCAPALAFPHPVRGLLDRIKELMHRSREAAALTLRRAASIPHRVVEIHTHRERHLLKGRCP